MWRILESGGVQKTMGKCHREIQEKYEFWKNVIRVQGPQGLRLIKGFQDEALKGQWHGYRSSRIQYRVIYRVSGEDVSVYVVDVTAHDYRRR